MDKRVYKTKKAIRDAMLELILQYDYNKITVKMITDKANIGRKTFYLHYGCIEDVILDYKNTISLELEQSINKNFFNTENDIHNIFMDLTNLIKNNIEFYRRIAKNDTYFFMRNIFEQMLEEAINKIYFKSYKTDSTNVSYYSSFYAAGMTRLFFDYLKGSISISLDDVRYIITRACLLSLDDIIKRNHEIII
ncbi:MAG: TetR/AcrR family transcriptional regulator [bacterium]|nr:TetR/AcrR family transcriptional regulator [bacterium]